MINQQEIVLSKKSSRDFLVVKLDEYKSRHKRFLEKNPYAERTYRKLIYRIDLIEKLLSCESIDIQNFSIELNEKYSCFGGVDINTFYAACSIIYQYILAGEYPPAIQNQL